jgi:cytochrome c oxidase cbb3-type subunit 3
MTDRRHKVVSLVIASLLAGSAACGRPTEISVRPDEVSDFRTLYAANCTGCHGTDGRGGVAQPLNDPVYLAIVSDARLIDVISRGERGTPMTAFAIDAGGTLTNAQVRALVDGIRRNWGSTERIAGVTPPPYRSDEIGDPTRGRTAYETYCARCHGRDGRGGPSAGSVVDAAFLSLTSDQALRTTIIAGRSDENIPGWREYVPGQPMSSQQVSDVVAWLASHRGSHD